MRARALLGKKVGMTQIFAEDGQVVPVTVLAMGPCVVLEKKSCTGKDGYSAIKIGYDEIRPKLANKPRLGYFAKLGVKPMRHIREIRMAEEDVANYEVGSTLGASLFEQGDFVMITACSRGRGFAGVIKRWGFKGFRVTHGVHESFRGPGSVGSNTWPARIWKGKKMPGQFGNKPVTVENLEVVKVLPEKNVMMVRGAVPGHRNAVILVKQANKKWKRN